MRDSPPILPLITEVRSRSYSNYGVRSTSTLEQGEALSHGNLQIVLELIEEEIVDTLFVEGWVVSNLQ